jgi:hypothetical protein
LEQKMKASALFFSLIILLTGCESGNVSKPQKDEGPVSIITGETGGWSLSDFMNQSGSQSTTLPVNAVLWRASLDIAALLPISDVDTFGGTIVTDWYSLPENPNERIKLTFFVVGRELRSDAVRVVVNVKTRDGLQGNWGNNFKDLEFGRRLEDLVLNRAREIRAESLKDIAN